MLIDLVKMLFILILCPVLLGAVQTLSIDSQLGTSIEDCFERFSIGDQLPRDAIYRNVSELTTRECELLCKQDKQCQSYDYGVGAKGNATCNLSNISEKELKEKNIILRHPDYDVYVRRFQCEQSPPTPLQTQFDDPGDGSGPAHRPIFRPDDDDPRRPLDDYLLDSRPFESTRPDIINSYRPQQYNQIDNDRPDDYGNQKPLLNAPPSYGDHRPQDIPFKPVNHPYKPSRPNQSFRPDYHDIFNIQDPYRPSRPVDTGYWRPDPYRPQIEDDIPDLYGQKPNRPNRPHDGLEKPVYHYIVRPHRKPKPDSKPDPYDKPLDYRPNQPRPEKPSYNYNSQYASNYGQSTYQDNSIYVEIHDPPRPYQPPKRPVKRPSYESQSQGYGQNYGYGESNVGYGSSQSSHSTFTQSQNSYGQGTITEIENNNQDYIRPTSSGYGQSSGYGSSGSSYGSSSYGSQDYKPTKRPLYQSNEGYGSGSYSANQSYSGSRPTYGSQESYGQTMRPNRPSYGGSAESYGESNQGYGSQNTYRPSLTGYFEQQDSQYSSHGTQSQSYGVSLSQSSLKPGYSQKPSYGRPGYSGSSYGNRPQYEIERPSYGNDRPSYENRPSYGSESSYEKPSYSERPYGDNRPNPPYDRPTYGSNRPIDNRPSYGNERPTYGSNRPIDDRPSYDNNRPSNINRPSNNGGYNRPQDNNRPDPAYDNSPYDQDTTGYSSQGNSDIKPTKPRPNQTDYNSNRPEVKPVYEYEIEKPNNVPSYVVRPGGEIVTSKPVVIGDFDPGYGRNPGHRVSYKGKWFLNVN